MTVFKALALVAVLGLGLVSGVRAGDFDVTGYEVAVRPDLAAHSLSGSERISFRGLDGAVQRLTFSANGLVIDSATLDGKPVAVTMQGHERVFDLPQAVGEGVLVLSWHGVPARGVVWTQDGLYTSYFACDWMVCRQDTPGDKASLSLALTVPDGLTSLGPGARTVDGGVQTWTTALPYSSYLYGFAIGRFVQVSQPVEGGQVVYLSDLAGASELTPLFGQTPDMVRFLSEKAGLPLPAGGYAQLLVAQDEAQEAATFSVIGRAEITPVLSDPSDDWVIVHELAHQWWGNLVTCATWRDFWLNEGITTFMTAAWKEQRFGHAAYVAELDIARDRLAKARELGYDKPLAWGGSYPSLRVRRAVQYSKGALFMDELRTALGEDAFWDGLRSYTREHAGGVVTSVDLQKAMEAASGRDLSGVFGEWVYGDE